MRVARKDMHTTHMRAAEAEPVWREDPAAGQAAADEPKLHCFHPETCTPGGEWTLATAGLLAHHSEAVQKKNHFNCLLTHLNESKIPFFFPFSLKMVSCHLCRKSSGDIGHDALVGIQSERSQSAILHKQPARLRVAGTKKKSNKKSLRKVTVVQKHSHHYIQKRHWQQLVQKKIKIK